MPESTAFSFENLGEIEQLSREVKFSFIIKKNAKIFREINTLIMTDYFIGIARKIRLDVGRA